MFISSYVVIRIMLQVALSTASMSKDLFLSMKLFTGSEKTVWIQGARLSIREVLSGFN